MARLGDLGSEEFETAETGGYPAIAGDHWLVLLDGGRPVCALSPGSVLDAATPPPPIIVAPAGLDLHTALASSAFAQAGDVTAVILVEDRRVVGVWGASRTQMVVRQGLVPTRGKSVLPGASSQIPLLVWYCRYREREVTCATVGCFPSKPFPVPDCRNDRNLSTHPFRW